MLVVCCLWCVVCRLVFVVVRCSLFVVRCLLCDVCVCCVVVIVYVLYLCAYGCGLLCVGLFGVYCSLLFIVAYVLFLVGCCL